MKRPILIAMVLAGCLAPVSGRADCPANQKQETLTGKLDYDLEDAALVATPYTLVAGGESYALYPDGPYFGMKAGDEGYEQNATNKLRGFENGQVAVSGCTDIDGTFRSIGAITNVSAA